MKIWIICSKAFYPQIAPIQAYLENAGHQVTLPNSYDNPQQEMNAWSQSPEEHVRFKQKMFSLSRNAARNVDAALVLNYEKHGLANYIGGATFLEIYDAFCAGKKIFLMNDIPEGILYDELQGMAPTVINGDLSLIR